MIASSIFTLSTLALSALAAVPADLSGGFNPDEITIQASFGGDSSNGFSDGQTFQLKDVQKTPSFAFGDSSGVNAAQKYMILLADTTDPDPTKRVLHYLGSDFQASGDETQLASQTQPMMPYMAPGKLGEKGQRSLSFLLYQQKGPFAGTNMPKQGQPFKVQDFIKANGLAKAQAGVSFSVNVDGGSGSSGASPSGSGSSSGSASASASSVVAGSTTPASPAIDGTSPTSTVMVMPGGATSAPMSGMSMSMSGMSAVPSDMSMGMSMSMSVSMVMASGMSGMSGMSSGTAMPTGSMNSTNATMSMSGSATATGSAAATKSSGAAAENRGKAFASLPLLVLAGIFLG